VIPVAPSDELALEATSVSKAFGGVLALRSFDLRIAAGEIHALVGENGSGKSSTIKILSGYYRPEPGSEVRIGGQNLRFGSPESAYALGGRFVQQDLGLVDTSSILDNLCMNSGFPTRWGTIRSRQAKRAAIADLRRVGLDVDPEVLIGGLSPAMKAGVAVARALRDDKRSQAKLLVLDEPTATLPEHEVEQLLDTLRRVAATGVAVLYVTHRLDEVFEIADNVTVLRDGTKVTSQAVASLDRPALVHFLVGTELEEIRTVATRPGPNRTGPVLAVADLVAGALRGVSFEVFPGEVVGVAGITGSGRETILGALFGGTHREGGHVGVSGQTVPPMRPDIAIGQGVAYLPPDRKTLGGILDLSAAENLTLANLKPFWRRLRLRRGAEVAETNQWFEQLSVRPANGANLRLGSFSGGNQQKILFGKWLRCRPKVLLLDEPTQGVDIAAKAELHRQILVAAQGGAAVIVSSSDVDELEVLCDRILVLRGGDLAAELTRAEISVEAISKACLGTGEAAVA
jgi:ribose transport system ATP-binding protein